MAAVALILTLTNRLHYVGLKRVSMGTGPFELPWREGGPLLPEILMAEEQWAFRPLEPRSRREWL